MKDCFSEERLEIESVHRHMSVETIERLYVLELLEMLGWKSRHGPEQTRTKKKIGKIERSG